MSKITEMASVWLPPTFPPQGRLPSEAAVRENCYQQSSDERRYHDELCLAAGRRVGPPCCKTLHISLFFDGTGNNLHNDQYLSAVKHPSNIARLFRAAIGSGTAGGVPAAVQESLMDNPTDGEGKYFKFYIPGVGTPFPEVNDLEYSTMGLAAAAKGEERINWALLRIIDVLKFVSTDKWLSNAESRTAIKTMATRWNALWQGGSCHRFEEFQRLLKLLALSLMPLLTQPEPGKPRLLGIRLYIYGFSRGAAAARTFVRWLSELLPPPLKEGDIPPQYLEIGEQKLQLPLSVEFLGLLDTVASVGIAHTLPLANGHMSWASDTMELPDDTLYPQLIKKCVHLVAAHEQRLSFPLDSVRRGEGSYPAGTTEVIYPGMHSDIGGGYPPGDQGKGNGPDDSLLLSQITLHDLYAAGFAAGAPLKVPQDVLPEFSRNDWRVIPFDLITQFLVSGLLINRFNAWRELTLNLATADKISAAEAMDYLPLRATSPLETIVEEQLGWITGWRIERYANWSLLEAGFYQRATNTDAQPADRQAAKKARDKKQLEIERLRRQQLAETPADKVNDLLLLPGVKDFDPDMAKTQLYEAAKEFAQDYHNGYRTPENLIQVLDIVLQQLVFLINSDDEPEEYRRMKREGERRVKTLFPEGGEQSNAQQASGRVRALFDEQVHDSRAWFMYATLNSREMWTGYFRYRMIYFAANTNKSLSPVVIAGDLVGITPVSSEVVLSFTQRNTPVALDGLVTSRLEMQVRDAVTGQLLAEWPGSMEQRAFTHSPGLVVAAHKQQRADQQLRLARAAIPDNWLGQDTKQSV